jgi:hypothetical protein
MKRFEAFRSLQGLSNSRPPVLEWGTTLLLLGLLAAPSIWMLNSLSPLWRDIDAYIQVTQPPGAQTILQYGPLYCFIARIPLFLGYAVDSLRTGNPVSFIAFCLHPILTNPGVAALLLSQHMALCFSAYYLISEVSRLFLVRLLLAGVWAVNPLFYAFAHCVGSETLSMILLVLLGATGLRIVLHRRKVPKTEWLLFGLLLWLSMLTRHLNALLVILMPVTFSLLSAHRLIVAACARSKRMRRGQRLWARHSLHKASVTLVIGFSCIVLTNVSVRGLCSAAHIPYRFQAGFPFLWRLEFLTGLPPETANEFLDRLAADSSAPDVQKVISQLREAIHETTDWQSTTFMREAQTSLFAPASKPEEELMPVLNRTLLAFLWPPRDVFVNAVATDFAKSRMVTIPNVVRSLFVHTIFYYSHRDAMPGYAPLATFLGKNEGEILANYKRYPYFYRRKGVSYNTILLFWFVMISMFVVLRKRSCEMAIVYYAAGLTLVGSFMMLANCLLNQFQPRYTLPMWELMIISISVVFGRGMERWFESRRSRSRSPECI